MTLEDIAEQLGSINATLAILVERQFVRAWYSTDQFARLVNRKEYTVRDWCRRGRVNAAKRKSGRGAHTAWVIAHEELLRLQREGLLAPKK